MCDFGILTLYQGKSLRWNCAKKPKNTLADLRAYSGFADPNLPCVIFHPDYSVDVEEMEAVDEQIAELKARIKELEEIKLRLEPIC